MQMSLQLPWSLPWPQILAVAAGSAAGGALRFTAILIAQRLWGAGFPVGTLFVNVTGSFLMGLLSVWVMTRTGFSESLRLLLTTGLLGGFTTFSAFSLEALLLLERGQMMAFGLYVGLSVGLSLLAVFAGVIMARWAFVGV